MTFFLALKRFLRPGALLMLLLVFLTIRGGAAAGHSTQLRPCGLVCEDSHPAAQEVAQALRNKGFVSYESRETMAEDISFGVLDCGAVLLPGVGQQVSQGKPAGCVLLLTAPDSFLTEAYEAHISAALYTAAAPAMTALSAQEAGVELTRWQVREKLDEMKAEGLRFTFSITTADGAPVTGRDLGLAIAQAAAGLLLFAAIVPGTARAVADADRLWLRIGRKAALCRVLVPQLLWQGLFFALAAGLALPDDARIFPGFLLLLTALGLLIARLPLGPLLPAVLLGSLAAFPVYYEIADPRLEVLRALLPPCWLLKVWEYPGEAAAVGAVLTAMMLVFYPKRRRT